MSATHAVSCLWVTVRANEARIVDPVAVTTHRTKAAADRAVRVAKARGDRVEAMTAQVCAIVQRGHAYTEACQSMAGRLVEKAIVDAYRAPRKAP